MDLKKLSDRITIDADISDCPIENMMKLLAYGITMEDLLSDYPDLEPEDFLACL